MTRRSSFPTLLVLQALLDGDSEGGYGFELVARTGLPSGSVYPILRRLEERSLVASSWTIVQVERQRRRRRYHRLTQRGVTVASSETRDQRHALRLILTHAAAEAEIAPHAQPINAGEIEIRADRFQAFVGERSIDLTRREFELVELLAAAETRVLEREEIYLRLWGYEMLRGDRSVDVFVRKMRQKLEKASPGWRYIHTHFGIGYRFAAESLEEVDPNDMPSSCPPEWNPAALRGQP
jgi:DNA-binding response OmpR family regulator